MASVYKRPSRTGKGGTWRAVVRVDGHPPVCKTFDRKEQAEDWAEETEDLADIVRAKYRTAAAARPSG